jgi:cytochrome d ubiquinol oxidase subunit I
LKLMAHAPAEGESPPGDAPIRSAGITPAAAVEPDRKEPR